MYFEVFLAIWRNTCHSHWFHETRYVLRVPGSSCQTLITSFLSEFLCQREGTHRLDRRNLLDRSLVDIARGKQKISLLSSPQHPKLRSQNTHLPQDDLQYSIACKAEAKWPSYLHSCRGSPPARSDQLVFDLPNMQFPTPLIGAALCA
jgi:hypothetical protein